MPVFTSFSHRTESTVSKSVVQNKHHNAMDLDMSSSPKASVSDTVLSHLLVTNLVVPRANPFNHQHDDDVDTIEGQFGTRGYHGFGAAPSDPEGAVVWYCSNCGDGPIGNWQNTCSNCPHVRCTGCRTEQTN